MSCCEKIVVFYWHILEKDNLGGVEIKQYLRASLFFAICVFFGFVIKYNSMRNFEKHFGNMVSV